MAVTNGNRVSNRIPNKGPMGDFIGPFDVSSKLTDEAYHVHFSHLWNGIATRRSDTVDSKFFVDGHAVLVGLSHIGLRSVARGLGRAVTDREASFIAAEYLRERLEQADERRQFDVGQDDVARLAEKIGLR